MCKEYVKGAASFYFLVSSEFFVVALLCCSGVGLFSGHPKLATCWLIEA